MGRASDRLEALEAAVPMRPRLVYIVGVGPNGSTLLGRLLGRHPSAVSVGDLLQLPELAATGGVCGCGRLVSECDDFWVPVLAAAFPGQRLADLADVRESIDSARGQRQTLRTLRGFRTGGSADDAAAYLVRAVEAVGKVAGATHVIDASKELTPFVSLIRSGEVDVKVIHLVRDPRAIVSSRLRRERRSAFSPSTVATAVSTAAWWELADLAAANVHRLGGFEIHEMLFENLLERPEETLEAACEFIGFESDDFGSVVNDRWMTLDRDHVLGSDDVPFETGSVPLPRAGRWRHEMGPASARFVSTLTSRGRTRRGLPDVADFAPLELKSVGDRVEVRPGVSAVVATHGRPELVRRTIDAIVAQRYNGPVEVVVVHDNEDIDPGLPRVAEVDGHARVVRSIANVRSQGLAGARNSGIAECSHDLVGFCDDDDIWFPQKLARQVDRLVQSGCRAVVCGIEIEFDGVFTPRVPAMEMIEMHHLLRSRVVEAHPSGYLFRRSLLNEIGPVDETLAGSYAEDYEFLLRIARTESIATVQEPLIRVLWGRTSFFAEGWRNRIEALTDVLEEFPEFAAEPAGLARIQGQISFAYASMGQTDEARRWARMALKSDPTQPRVLLAGAVASGLVGSSTVIKALQTAGRGV